MSSAAVNRGEAAVAETIKGVAEFFDIARSRNPACPDTVGLHRLADSMDGSSEITRAELAECRRCVDALRKYASGVPMAEMVDIERIARIRFALEDAEESGIPRHFNNA